MRTFFLCILVLLGYSYSSAQPSDSLRVKSYDFLISMGELQEFSKTENTLLIINDLVTYEEFKNQEYGIFRLCTFASESYIHILLVDANRYIFVDMRQPFDATIHIILEYLKNYPNYTQLDIINYLDAVVNLYQRNKDAIPWKDK